MGTLSAHARSLLDELAKDNGVGPLDFDADGLIPMTIQDTLVAVAYSPANDAFLFVTAVAAADQARASEPWAAFAASGRLADRRTRLAVEPGSKALMLVREVPLAALAYWQLREALEEFLRDRSDVATGGSDHPVGPNAPPPLSTSDLMVFRV